MRTLIPKKATTLFALLTCSLLFIFFISCKKDINSSPGIPDETPDLLTKINSSVSGFVTDENNAPVTGASVQVGTVSTTTNQFGYFQVRNAEVVKSAAVVTVIQAGYFKGIKTYAATDNKAAFFRIKLIPKTIAGTIHSDAGGSVTLSNGLIVSLPANGVVVAADNTTYTGDINVAAFWINPEATDLTEIMPGDLRAVDKNGFIKGLTTYGMAAVELTGASGQLLQVAAGKKATITMPLSPLLSAAAPSIIPLWYFDESSGLWKEDGIANKSGNVYIGNVSHFSYWNCDLPNAIVPLTFTVIDQNGSPVENAHVEITPTTPNSWSHVGGYTDSTGYVSVFVTPDATYNLSIYEWGGSCNATIVQNFSVTNVAVNLGQIVLLTTSQHAYAISGTLTDCNNLPVRYGDVYILIDNLYYLKSVDTMGAYQLSITTCSQLTSAVLTGMNTSAYPYQSSASQTYALTEGTTTIANINVPTCASTGGGGTTENAISNGYLYHPSSPRAITDRPKTVTTLSPTSVSCELGDMGALGYFAVFDIDPVNHITITTAPGAGGGPYQQWDTGLPAANPGYTPQWTGSSQCNNTYDPATHTYYVRYGYTGGTGFRITEEIIQVQ